MIDYDDEYDDREGDDELPQCSKCHDTGQVVAADGFHEYLGYQYVACNCRAGLDFVPMPPSNPYGE